MTGFETPSVQHQLLTWAQQKRNSSLMSPLMKLQFKSNTLAAFWTGVEKDPLLPYSQSPGSTPSFCHLLTMWDGFFCSCLNQDKIQIEAGHWKCEKQSCNLTAVYPRFEKICSTKQAHPSHWKDCGTSKHKSNNYRSEMFIFGQKQVWKSVESR